LALPLTFFLFNRLQTLPEERLWLTGCNLHPRTLWHFADRQMANWGEEKSRNYVRRKNCGNQDPGMDFASFGGSRFGGCCGPLLWLERLRQVGRDPAGSRAKA